MAPELNSDHSLGNQLEDKQVADVFQKDRSSAHPPLLSTHATGGAASLLLSVPAPSLELLFNLRGPVLLAPLLRRLPWSPGREWMRDHHGEQAGCQLPQLRVTSGGPGPV